MKRETFLIVVIVALLLSNILLIGFLVVRPKPMHGPDGPKHKIIEKLNFDADQIGAYEELISVHRKEIENLNNDILEDKKTLYSYLNQDNKASNVDSLITAISLLQSQVEKTHYNHFKDIRSLCKPNQLKNYEELTTEISQLFSFQKPKRR
jgi:protein CpxP